MIRTAFSLLKVGVYIACLLTMEFQRRVIDRQQVVIDEQEDLIKHGLGNAAELCAPEHPVAYVQTRRPH